MRQQFHAFLFYLASMITPCEYQERKLLYCSLCMLSSFACGLLAEALTTICLQVSFYTDTREKVTARYQVSIHPFFLGSTDS